MAAWSHSLPQRDVTAGDNDSRRPPAVDFLVVDGVWQEWRV